MYRLSIIEYIDDQSHMIPLIDQRPVIVHSSLVLADEDEGCLRSRHRKKADRTESFQGLVVADLHGYELD